eukprot:TRINITY_DN4156_c3_g1_i2.p1 TRINITY_DN4156_c3_g1~~TRINITY_DN4156_c3_g1_i2.p1  ORF type:complete len:462 (-),score=125.77 TRINITY_DN4156_c3_g1_i2:153-1538(-)
MSSFYKRGKKEFILDDENEKLIVDKKKEKWLDCLNAIKPKNENSYSVGIWDDKLNLIEVLKMKSVDWSKLGLSINGKRYLYIEEALFLLESTKLLIKVKKENLMEEEIDKNDRDDMKKEEEEENINQEEEEEEEIDIKVKRENDLKKKLENYRMCSIQECFEYLYLSNVPIKNYLVYSYLKRQGFIIQRYNPLLKCTSEEIIPKNKQTKKQKNNKKDEKINISLENKEQHNEHNSNNNNENNENNENNIPKSRSWYPKETILPQNYVAYKRFMYNNSLVIKEIENYNLKQSKLRNNNNNNEENKSYLNRILFDISNLNKIEEGITFQYDVWKPRKGFSIKNPPPPNFRIVVCSWDDPHPSLSEIEYLFYLNQPVFNFKLCLITSTYDISFFTYISHLTPSPSKNDDQISNENQNYNDNNNNNENNNENIKKIICTKRKLTEELKVNDEDIENVKKKRKLNN